MECEPPKLHQLPPLKSDSARIKILHFKHDVAFVGRGCGPTLPICSVSLETSKWPISSVIATPGNLAWTPGGQVTQILDEVSVRVQHMTGIKASAQLDCTGREHGVLQLNSSDKRHDGLCPRCLAQRVEEKVTMVHTAWQCL